MSNRSPLVDAEARHLGETTFDRNVVVLAGAGTGKTTLLVNRLLHALLREPRPFRLTEILALTFTNKAANEMKARLRERLHEFSAACQSVTQNGTSEYPLLQSFQIRYQISAKHIENTITQALNDLEQAHITTLHSFAAHVLRLYPLESGVDPHFQEDDGTHFVQVFSEVWDRWLDEALGEDGTHHAQWREILDVMDLKGIRECALALCDDHVSISEIHRQLDAAIPSPAVMSWLEKNRQRIASLLREYGPAKPRKIEKVLILAERVFHHMLGGSCVGDELLDADELALLASALGQAPKAWDPSDFQEARRMIQSAQRLVKVDEEFLKKMVSLLEPFVKHVRQLYADKGWIRFDGLIVRVRDVLRDFPHVREQLKADFQAIMVDEFQDTDPLQYEILLYLGERLGEHCQQWDAIRLMPGKLFIVGDPKQSIYGFRRADIQAFDHVVRRLTDDGGVVCTLATNFRSGRAVLDVVNGIFDRLFVQEEHVQPPNVPLMAGRGGEEVLPEAGVKLCVMAKAEEEEWDADRATRVEAEWLAAWLQEQLTSDTQWVSEGGIQSPLRPGHVAVLFRKFTNAHVYLEAMHRRGVPYLTDGERHFYRRQEVIDLVNVLRVLDDPTDAIALVGILRSSLGGVPDQDIMSLVRIGPLDIRRTAMLESWNSPRKAVVTLLFEQLNVLHVQAKRIPVFECIDQIFSQLPVLELAAASSHGEQAVRNIWKLRDLMTAQAAIPHLSFSGWVAQLVESIMTHPPEPEAVLEEESLDAVRVLSIHKAKGLEFPVVVLPGLHQKSSGIDRHAHLSADWMSGVYGCTFPPTWNVGQVFLWEKEQICQKAEQRRVMYVGMTRARDRLVLSGGKLIKPIGESFLGFLQDVAQEDIGNPEHDNLHIGESVIRQTVVTSRDLLLSKNIQNGSKSGVPEPKRAVFLSPEKDREREMAWEQIVQDRAFLSPSLLHTSPSSDPSYVRQIHSKLGSQQIGTLVHRILEQWNFQLDLQTFREPLQAILRNNMFHDRSDQETDLVVADIEELMEAFLHSSSYDELHNATILGREVPFVIPWTDHETLNEKKEPRIMEGIMDVVYEKSGEVWVGDYKTDRVTTSNVVEYAERYRSQAHIYANAAFQSLGPHVEGCKLFFLRIGEVVTVKRGSTDSSSNVSHRKF